MNLAHMHILAPLRSAPLEAWIRFDLIRAPGPSAGLSFPSKIEITDMQLPPAEETEQCSKRQVVRMAYVAVVHRQGDLATCERQRPVAQRMTRAAV